MDAVCRSLPAICCKRSCGTTQCGCQSWAKSKLCPVLNVRTTSYQKTNASLDIPFWVLGRLQLQLQQPCSQHPKCGSTQRGKDEGHACLASGWPMRPPQPVAFQLLAHHGHIYIEALCDRMARTCPHAKGCPWHGAPMVASRERQREGWFENQPTNQATEKKSNKSDPRLQFFNPNPSFLCP
jgi:hypothetical protein